MHSQKFAFIFLFFLGTSLIAQESDFILNDLNYRNIGPTRGGRSTTVTGVSTQPNVFYMGATGGGVWKTTDYGQSWKNISDGYFATPSIGAIRVANSDSDIVYVGTGSDGIRSNIITGKGMYKSTDAGKSWESIGLEKVGQIGAVEIDPSSPDRVFVAAIGQAFEPNPERGVFRTLNGGKSWEKVFFHSDSIGVSDLEFAPDNAYTIYAGLWQVDRKPWTIRSGGTEGGIYKSTDGGDTWEKLENGLPTGLIGKVDLAVSADDPDRLYALIEAPQGEGGLFRSDDRGASFELVSTKKELLDRPFYYCNVDANPTDADEIFVNSTQFWKSTSAGKSWQRLRTPHGDNHDVWINPLAPEISVQANDGGANVSRDGMKTWSTQINQSTAELYQVEVDDQFPYWLYAGQQDNSTIAVPSLPPYNSISGPTQYWKAIGGCETGPAVPKPGNPDIVYSNCKGRFGVFNKKTGQEMQYYVGAANMYGQNPKDLKFRFQRVSPIHVSQHNPDVIYHTSQFVHKSTDDGKTWEIISPDLTAFTPETQVISGSPITRDVTGEEFYSTIYAIRESPVTEGVIWVGANDGPVHVTRDGGNKWRKVTPRKLPPGGRIDCVEPSPHNAAKAYFTSLRYQLGDWKPYIYKTSNYGRSWELITAGIPDDYPVRVVREDPEREGLLYAGTEFGMFISFDDGKSWEVFQQNLPVTPITDIKVYRGDLTISTMGRGFWIMDDLSPLHIGKQELASKSARLFSPKQAYRMAYYPTGTSSIPYYPSPGMNIDYYLPDSAETLEIHIMNADNEIIRAFNNKKQEKEEKDKSVSMATGFGPLGMATKISDLPGHHRIRWDLRHVGISRSRGGRSQGGPKVAPGKYQLKMLVNGNQMESEFEVLPDPRVIEAGVSLEDMAVQENLSLKIRDMLNEAREFDKKVQDQVEAVEKQLEESKDDEALKSKLADLEVLKDKLTTPEGRYMVPGLLPQMGYLYNMLLRADQRPGKDAEQRFSELQNLLAQLKESTSLDDQDKTDD